MTHDTPTPLAELVTRHGRALNTAEDARGYRYSFHRRSGRADLDLPDAVGALRAEGLDEVAAEEHRGAT